MATRHVVNDNIPITYPFIEDLLFAICKIFDKILMLNELQCLVGVIKANDAVSCINVLKVYIIRKCENKRILLKKFITIVIDHMHRILLLAHSSANFNSKYSLK